MPARRKRVRRVMLYRPRTAVELPGDFLVAAALREQIQHRLVAGRHFDLVEIDHFHSFWQLPFANLCDSAIRSPFLRRKIYGK